ncbi:alkylhydroperoxidase/carboxymuconolactone decarboxylase family protein [Cellulophaga tyrosinoxydans]|uniref:Alkylhydroperoxidase/carboxymuconolactone decarboxylase family protein n=2 Tax=Cellulophaga tyrosinoxydans TaxID=504486 RepID=A0A1W1YQW3_9FLAO|nr:alkylhydroperoxidase/carboxymuconolactone decarboxylase family protein [Cellulophaga tyrosinoxydans]
MDKKIEHIGLVAGKVLVFGGVYSNLQALEALIEIASKENIAPENCICTGDIVGYCAQPEETVALFKNWGARSISGNVEQQLFEDAEDCGCDFTAGSRCDGFSKMWYPYAKSKLSPDSISWMGTLPNHITFNYVGKKVAVVHGSYDNVSEFVFESTPEEVKQKVFKSLHAEVILAGHCGLPFIHQMGAQHWINPGVIGMPANDGTTRVWYMILEDVGGELKYTHRYLEYDYTTAYVKMKENHLPMEYAETLLSGLWDNMEILPETEKRLKGIPYNFENETKYNQSKTIKTKKMADSYYDPADLRKFGKITEWSEELGTKFFDYYGKVFEEGALSAREKSLIALAVSHVVKCPYCIDSYTKDGLQKGITKEEMMEAVHVGAAIESGATLVHGVQMMKKYDKLSM